MQAGHAPGKRGRPREQPSAVNGIVTGNSTPLPPPPPPLARFDNDFRSSNLTTNHFLGAKERSWMRNQHTANTPQTRPTSSAAPVRRLDLSTPQNVQTSVPHPQPTRVSPPEEAAPRDSGQDVGVNAIDVDTRSNLGCPPEILDLTVLSQEDSTVSGRPVPPTTSNLEACQLASIQPIGPPTAATPAMNAEQRQIVQSLPDEIRSISAASLLDSRQERPMSIDLNGFNVPGPVVNTSIVTPNPPPNQLLTPVASPEQVLQNLQRKRTVDAAQMSDSSLQPPLSRVRSDSLLNAPVAGHIPQQPTFATPETRHVDVLPTSVHPIPGYPPNSLHRQASLSRSVQFHPSPAPAPPQLASTNQTSHRRTLSHTLTSKGQSYLAVLQNTTDDLRRHVEFTPAANQLRYPWLCTACQDEDLIFLLLNQILCTSFLDENMVRSLGFGDNHIAGVRILQMLFGNNAELPREFLEFLAGWPNSVYSLRSSPELKSWLAFISLALTSIGTNWNPCRLMYIQRQIPPGAREIAETFKCNFSQTLSRAIFSSLSRQILNSPLRQYPPTTNTEALHLAAFELFVKDQENYLLQLGSLTSLPHTNDSKMAFGTAYMNLYQAYFGRTPHPLGPPPSPVNLSRGPGTQSNTGIVRAQPVPPPPAKRTHTIPSNASLSYVPMHHPAVIQGGHVRPSGPPSVSAQSSQQTRLQTAPSSVQIPTSANTPSHPRSPSLAPISLHQLSTEQQNPPAPRYVHGTIPSMPSGANATPHNQQVPRPIQQNFIQSHIGPISQPQTDLNSRRVSAQSPMTRSDDIPLLSTRPPQLLANPVPNHEAIHLGHLQEPKPILSQTLPITTKRIYQFVDSLILAPHRFTSHSSLFTASFDIDGEKFSRVAPTKEVDDVLCPPTRTIGNDTIIFHLRCAQVAQTDQNPSLSTWAALPTHWPEQIYITLNGQHLEFRRKRHYKRDLAIDITAFVRKGKNDVVVCFYAEKQDLGKTFAIACETIAFHDPATVIKLPEKIAAQTSLDSILKAMQPALSRDDDVEIVTDSLILSVTDPFSSSLYLTPVRGKTCLHRECFSLETFLESRTSDNGDILTSVSQWLCPHCKRDARPSSLVIDGFIQEVCQKLIASGQSDAKAIVLKPDGSWTVRNEDDDEQTGQREGRARSTPKVGTPVPTKAGSERPPNITEEIPSAAVAVIDLDSD